MNKTLKITELDLQNLCIYIANALYKNRHISETEYKLNRDFIMLTIYKAIRNYFEVV